MDSKPRVENSAYGRKPDGKSMHGRIVRELGQRIVGGQLKPGERLPAEAALLASYEVSRPVLREAVRVLVAKGLVVSKQRAGAIVRPARDWHLLDPDVLYWLIQTQPKAEFVGNLVAVRRIIEPAAAALAARSATREQLQAIAEALAGMEKAQTPEELLEPDVAFHRRVAEATNNPLLAYIGNMLSLALRESIQLTSPKAIAHELSLPRHKAILTAIANHDPLAAQQAALVQLQLTEDDLATLLPGAIERG
ncbi:MAG: FadR family transcriptional regulator [Burkholderiales bacterium]|nr:FadR family transcriptional regulator [Burkholderiales bacterium]